MKQLPWGRNKKPETINKKPRLCHREHRDHGGRNVGAHSGAPKRRSEKPKTYSATDAHGWTQISFTTETQRTQRKTRNKKPAITNHTNDNESHE